MFKVPHAIKWCSYKTLFINYIIVSYYQLISKLKKKNSIDELHVITIIN